VPLGHYDYRLRDVRVDYGRTTALALGELDLVHGEAVAVVGPSGAGKTTLLRVLGLAQTPSTGTVTINDRPAGALTNPELRRARADIGFVHQDFRLVPNLRVLQNVLCGRLGRMSLLASLRALLAPSKRDVGAVYNILERVGIEEKLYQRTDTLSGGQQQRAAIARALYQQPRVLLADEPISNVDPARADETVRLLVDICRGARLTLCASMHNIDLARALFDRIIGLREGRIVFDRTADTLTETEVAELYRLSESADGRESR
jgi:phosphonate transport system ATP-binding protein